MKKDFYSVLKERNSVRVYDKEAKISKEEISEIIDIATTAPSAWNLQNWGFIVFHSEESKKQLLPIAFNQEAIVDASVTIAVLGDVEGDKKFDLVYNDYISKGFMTSEVKSIIEKQVKGSYENPQYARDAAFSNSSLAAMQLMLVAEEKGYSTLAVGGFNKEEFKKEFNIDKRYEPNMLIVIGKASKEAHPTTRLKVDEVTKWL